MSECLENKGASIFRPWAVKLIEEGKEKERRLSGLKGLKKKSR